MTLLAWLEATAVARAIGESLPLTAWLSAFHLIGFTLVMGGAVIVNLRLLGALLQRVAVAEIAKSANRVIGVGLCVSVATGLLMFSTRATIAAENGAFQGKMLLLAAAALMHFGVGRWFFAQTALAMHRNAIYCRVFGAIGLFLWLGLAATACWFILFE